MTAKTLRSSRQNKLSRSRLRTELESQLSEVTHLLVRILKAMRFTDLEIVSTIKLACDKERPPMVRFPTAGRGELWGNVLCRWMEDPRFVDESGQPKVIPISGSDISFAALVKQEAPGEAVKECLNGLIKMRSIVRIGPRRIRLRTSATIYSGYGATFVEGVLLSIRELLRTVSWNLIEQSKSGEPRLFQRGVTGVEITERDMDDLVRMVNVHGMTLLESFNGWANQRALVAKRSGPVRRKAMVQPYVGIYVSKRGS